MLHRSAILHLLVAILWTHTGPRSAAAARELRAGAAVDITPEKFPVIVNGMFTERQATGVHDRLHARALVLDDGRCRVAIVIADNLMMPRELLDEAKAAARAATGIPVEQMLMAATHSHSAASAMGCLGSDSDPVYPFLLKAQLTRVVIKAAAALEPARIGWAVIAVPAYTYNRRWIFRPDRVRQDPFGAFTVRANMHPGYLSPDAIGPSGPVDPGLTVVAVQARSGRPLAVLANYSMHYFGSPLLSADYFGLFADKLASRIRARPADPAPVVMMSQGTSGDLMWMDYGRAQATLTLDGYAEAMTQLALTAYRGIEYHNEAPLAMQEAKLVLERRVPDAQRLEWAKTMVAGLKGRKPTTQPEIYAREQLYIHEQPRRELKLQGLRIGGLGIAAIPDEVFALTGLKIKGMSPLEPTFTIELANGAEGYIPPPAQHRLGGYTTWPARTAGLEESAEPKITEAILKLLETVAGKPRRQLQEPECAYAKAVLASRPVAIWRLDEVAGPTAVDSMGGHPGQYEDGIAFYLDGPPLVRQPDGSAGNHAPHFAGGRLQVDGLRLGPDYTIELWCWNGLPADARPVTGYLFSHHSETAGHRSGDRLGIGGTAAGAGRLFVSAGDDHRPLLVGRTPLERRQWYHVALVRTGQVVEVYLNGHSPPEINGLLPADGANGPVFIGGSADRRADFAGKIDEVAVFNRRLAPSEIAAHVAARPNDSN